MAKAAYSVPLNVSNSHVRNVIIYRILHLAKSVQMVPGYPNRVFQCPGLCSSSTRHFFEIEQRTHYNILYVFFLTCFYY